MRHKRIWLGVSGVVLLAVVVTAMAFLWPKPIVSTAVRQQLTFALLMPQDGRFPLAPGSAKYDVHLKLLTITGTAFHREMTISEQPTPEMFTDVPQTYAKVLDGMTDYADFDTAIGTVHLTTPPQLDGKQAAVLNTKGTLLFAKPAVALSSDQWRQYFNSFVIAR